MDVEKIKRKYRRNARWYDWLMARPTEALRREAIRRLALRVACKEMMAMRQSMRAEQASADAKLNDLVATMNAASGEKKVDAIAAVVSEMVAQRQARHEKMAAMHGKMKAAMASCPMMQKGAGTPQAGKKLK